ncbi:MAG: hypothetical protein QOH71_2309 [Blastocatellia bacterium]|nr:hypothetical protein [Blastocatellia bacterium]
MRQPGHSSIYAISGSSSVYHLLYPDQDYTLCGFRAEKHCAEIAAKAALHVVEFVPPNRELCKQCDKMNNRRKGNSHGPGASGSNPGSLLSRESHRPDHAAFLVDEQKAQRIVF